MTLAVGLDIGNQRCVLAVSRNGVVDGILNEDSQRETPAVIQFAETHRLFGSAASSAADSTVSQLKRLVVKDGKNRGYSAVQLLAMLLAHVRRSAEATTRSSLSDCVIGIPSYFDERQRTTYLEAARVAGWNPLALLDEGAAIALEYRNDRPECADVVAFVDVGHSDTQISVMSFDRGGKNSISVVAKASDPDLGGRDFDKVIFDDLSRKFEKEKARLRMACEKAKKELSTNGVAHLSVITRAEFESMSSDLVRRIGDLFDKALKDARLLGYSVHSVELVGSGSRIPAILSKLAGIYGRETSRTLNGSESVARGCALLCERLISAQGNLSTMIESFGIPSSEYTLPSDASDLSKLEDVESKLTKKDIEYENARTSRNKPEAFVYEERNQSSSPPQSIGNSMDAEACIPKKLAVALNMTLAVGLDIGNQRCVVAVSRNGVVDSILNEDSERETPAVIQFADRHRLFGSAAAFAAVSTVSQLKSLVCEGREERGYSAVQLLAMLLAHVRRSAEATTRSSLSNCIIGIPSYFDERQRTAYLYAARVAGWNPLALLDEGAATALEYRNDRSSCAGVVAFVDVGHKDTQISVVRFQQGGNKSTMVVLKASDPNLGGRDFDKVIFDQFSRKLEAEHGIAVRSNTKATAKLMMVCEKAKKELSRNREAHLSVDSLIEDRDAKGVITRGEFESMSSELVSRIGDLFAKALEDARLLGYSVHSVELVGSGSRIPAIATKLAGIYGETSRTLNGSESVARGCALLCERLISNQGNPSTMMESFGIPSSEYTLPSDASDLSKLQKVESELAKKDREYESAGSSRNKLEAFIYDERFKWSKGVKRNMSRSREVLDVLEKREQWLYEEGEDQSEDVYKDILEELKRFISTYEEKNRQDEIQLNEGTGIEGTTGNPYRNPIRSSSYPGNHLLLESDQMITGREMQQEHYPNATISQPPAKQRHRRSSKLKIFFGNLTARMNGADRQQDKMIKNQGDGMNNAANKDEKANAFGGMPRDKKSSETPRPFFKKEMSQQEGKPRNASLGNVLSGVRSFQMPNQPSKKQPYMSPYPHLPNPQSENPNGPRPSSEPLSSSTLAGGGSVLRTPLAPSSPWAATTTTWFATARTTV